MNFIPPVEYVPKESKPAASSSAPRLRRKKSLTSLWHRNDIGEDVPAVPDIPKAFAAPSFGTYKPITSSPGSKLPLPSRSTECRHIDEPPAGFSVNETPSLGSPEKNNPAGPEGLCVSGVSFMHLSDSDSESAVSERPAWLGRIRRAISKTDLRSQGESSPSAPTSSPSQASIIPSSPSIDSPGVQARLRRPTDAGGTTAQRSSTYTNGSSPAHSVRSSSPWKAPPFPRVRHDSSSHAFQNPPLDPDFAFDDFITSGKPQSTPSPGMEAQRRPSKNAPPVDPARTCKYDTVSVQTSRESVEGYLSFLSQPRPRGLPMPDMIEEDEGEWTRAVEWVRGQEADRVLREAEAAKANEKILRTEEALRAQQEADWQMNLGLAKQFIRRTSTYWVPRQNSDELLTDEARRNAIAEALNLASKNGNSDPGFTELRRRFFAAITNPFSRSNGEKVPKSAPLPYRSAWHNASTSGRSSPSTAQESSASTERTFATCQVNSIRSNQLESQSQSSPSLQLRSDTTSEARNGLGIHVDAPDLDARDVALNGLSSPHPSSDTATEDAEARSRLQASASATLASSKVFKVDRDSKIQDRYVPKRGPDFYKTLDRERALAEIRMGVSNGPLPSPPFPRKDSMFENSPTPINKGHLGSSEQNIFKRVAKHPTLRTVKSTLSLRSPDATEIVQVPVTPTMANHPAFRSPATTPVTPTAKVPRQTFAQRFTSKTKTKTSRASTSTTSSDPAMAQLAAAISRSPSQKSTMSVATGEDRWAQRVRQKSKIEQQWKDEGVLSSTIQQPPPFGTPGIGGNAQGALSIQNGPTGSSQQSSLETPNSPVSLLSRLAASSTTSPQTLQNTLPQLSRRTQDSPTPLNIRKGIPSPKSHLGLSPDSPAGLQVPKLRVHPAMRRVLEQDVTDAPENSSIVPSLNSDKDPFAKSGSVSKRNEHGDWPLSNTSNEQIPTDGHFDSVITSWRHASATKESVPSSPGLVGDGDVTGTHQHVRNYLDLDRLHAPSDGKPHPNHPYRWDSMNVMCKDIHTNARNSSETTVTGTDDPSVRHCSFCRESCCYYGLQIGRANVQAMGRDQTLEELKNKAASHIFFLRGSCPNGIEEYQTLMECEYCGRICCPSCAVICQYPHCNRPVCAQCVESDHGICDQH